MAGKILVASIFSNEEFASASRTQGLEALGQLGEVVPYTQQEFTNADADGVLAIIADWGCLGSCNGDATGDGQVGVDDLLLVLAAWGPCPG